MPITTFAETSLASFIIRNHEVNQLPTVGDIDAKYTIVEFFDYRCGYCAKQAVDYNNILKSRNDIRIVYLEFPIFGGISDIAANIALKVWNDNPDLYFSIHNGFMNLGSSMNRENIIEVLDKNGLVGTEIFEFATSKPFNKTIQLNKNLARDLGLRGTPASIINDSMIPGYVKESKVIEIVGNSEARN
ncbi:DsbA family protein [Pelagibacterales bacterium]|nr:DsbA family protein [Pelagibacterales bacterium]